MKQLKKLATGDCFGVIDGIGKFVVQSIVAGESSAIFASRCRDRISCADIYGLGFWLVGNVMDVMDENGCPIANHLVTVYKDLGNGVWEIRQAVSIGRNIPCDSGLFPGIEIKLDSPPSYIGVGCSSGFYDSCWEEAFHYVLVKQ
ncbi:MAG: hypothetical protein WCT02_00300 [Candidatus Paceibacterota bacterium]|jgi:hypothetical protein